MNDPERNEREPGGVLSGNEPLSNRTREERWRAEFPFGWDADELVSRRQLLRWSVLASGALFASTGALAALAYTRERRRGSMRPIIA